MFKLGRLLDEEEYQHRIVPCLVKLFSSPDRTTRVKLLEKIDDFAPHLKAQVLNEKIYPYVIEQIFPQKYINLQKSRHRVPRHQSRSP